MAPQKVTRKLAAILAADVAGYTRLMEANEETTLTNWWDSRQSIIDPTIANYSGRIVKHTGDGFLAEFSTATEAVRCAIDMQKALVKLDNSRAQQAPFLFRMGVNLGEIVDDEEDIYGDGVNIAARLEQLSDPGGVLISKQVFDHVDGHIPVKFVSLGSQKVNNLNKKIDVYRIDYDDAADTDNVIRFGSFELDLSLFEIRNAGLPVPVEPQVFNLITYLARHGDRTVTKDELFENVWDRRVVSDSALSSQIKSARKVLDDDGSKQHTIRTIHGRGFRFVAPLEVSDSAAKGPLVTDSLGRFDRALTKPSAAVLPFDNLNNDPSEDYFAAGITEDIITALSKNRWLNVAARNPSFSFRDKSDGIKAIGKALNANYLVSGSVRKAGNRVRITVQLIDAEEENNI